jgi:hypothetical protein
MANQIQVYTYSPYINQWETDANSQFTLAYEMGGTACAPWSSIATNPGVLSGHSTMAGWGPLTFPAQYQWYVTINDGVYTVNSPVWNFSTLAPTAVMMDGFTSTVLDQVVQVDFNTLSEIDLLGFNLFRSEGEFGLKLKLNPQLIPARTPGELFGNDYQYLDTTALPGRLYYYWMEMVSRGGTQSFGPVLAQILFEFKLWLPIIIH